MLAFQNPGNGILEVGFRDTPKLCAYFKPGISISRKIISNRTWDASNLFPFLNSTIHTERSLVKKCFSTMECIFLRNSLSSSHIATLIKLFILRILKTGLLKNRKRILNNQILFLRLHVLFNFPVMSIIA